MTAQKKPREMMGIETLADQKIPVPVRDWNAMKLAMWRSKTALGIIERAAEELIPQCKHVEGCPGVEDDSEPCVKDTYETITDISGLDPKPFDPSVGADYVDNRTNLSVKSSRLISPGCPDRELRMSLLVILSAARQFAPVDARAPNGDMYMAPSREYFSEVLSSHGALEAEVECLREMLRRLGINPSAEVILDTPVAQEVP